MSKFKVGDRVIRLSDGEISVISDMGYYEPHRAFYYYLDGRTQESEQGWEAESLRLVQDSQSPSLTGGSSDYYKLEINGLVIECNDIIKALGLNFAQGNVFKAVWRIGADNIGKGKPGNTRLYNAEKVVFFGNDMVEMEKAHANG